MEFQVIDASVVIAAANHNPSILNPDFLSRPDNAIVPADWKLGEPPVSAFPVAQVVYENGFIIKTDPARLHFEEHAAERIPDETKLGEIASRYVHTLPHVKYTAVGCNFNLGLSVPTVSDASERIRKRFLKDGPWSRYRYDPMGLHPEIKLVFGCRKAKLSLTISPAQLVEGQQETAIIRVNANFHREAKAQTLEEIEGAIASWRDDLSELRSIAVEFLEG